MFCWHCVGLSVLLIAMMDENETATAPTSFSLWLALAGALGLALTTARQAGAAVLLLVAIPCAWTVLPGYVPVIRSHALTYMLFALTLFVTQCREGSRGGCLRHRQICRWHNSANHCRVGCLPRRSP